MKSDNPPQLPRSQKVQVGLGHAGIGLIAWLAGMAILWFGLALVDPEAVHGETLWSRGSFIGLTALALLWSAACFAGLVKYCSWSLASAQSQKDKFDAQQKAEREKAEVHSQEQHAREVRILKHKLEQETVRADHAQLVLDTLAPLAKTKSVHELLDMTVGWLTKELKDREKSIIAYQMVPDKGFAIIASHGFDSSVLQIPLINGHIVELLMTCNSGLPKTLGEKQLGECFAPDNRVFRTFKHALYLPVFFADKGMAVIALYFRNTAATDLPAIQEAVQPIIEMLAAPLYRAVMYEEEMTVFLSDQLTALPNQRALSKDITNYLAKVGTGKEVRPCSIILLEADILQEINDKYGRRVGDEMLAFLAQLLQASARIEELGSNVTPHNDHFYRYGGLQFIIVCEETDEVEALKIAQRLKAAVEEPREWPGGVPEWTVSAVTVTSPGDGENWEELLAKVETGLLYVKEKLGRNNVMTFSQVPRSYKVSKLSSKVTGSLNVFDPMALLQSLSQSGKSGILTVENSEKRFFWLFMENGAPCKAYLEKMKGDDAALEFLATFSDGTFKFAEYNTLDSEALEQLHSMDKTYNVGRQLEQLLMDGALAQDHISAAKRSIPSTRLFVKATFQARDQWVKLPSLDKTLTAQEVLVMESFLKHVNGRTLLEQIMSRLEDQPTHLKWRSVSVLLKHRVVEMSRLSGPSVF